jgi:CHASE1-domain containing sensor protein
MSRNVRAKAENPERANRRAMVLGLSGLFLSTLLLLLARSGGIEALRLINP